MVEGGGSAAGTRHLYVHLPFCRHRCAYCDFASEPLAAHQASGRVELYLDRVREEIESADEILAPALDTIYVGGGTPTALLRELLLPFAGALAGRLQPGGEFTVEANPESVDRILLEELRAAGVNRLSLGIQSFSEELRRTLGRRVPQESVDGALAAVREVGWQEWSLDLVYGIPGASWEDLRSDVERALSGGPAHISLYDLTYTDSFAARLRRRSGPQTRELAEAVAEEHYARVVDRLEEAGYRRYEVSNFAFPGHESRHNLAYWRLEDYLGVGAAAVSTVGLRRWTNPRRVRAYLEGCPREAETLDERTKMIERAMLGLRTREGVSMAEVGLALDEDGLARMREAGFAQGEDGYLRLGRRGLDLSTSVIADLLLLD